MVNCNHFDNSFGNKKSPRREIRNESETVGRVSPLSWSISGCCRCTVPLLRALRNGALLLIQEGSKVFPLSNIPQEARKMQGVATQWRMILLVPPMLLLA